MEMKIKNLARNTSYFTLALIMQKLIAFAYFVILTNHLEPDGLGKYYLAISVTTIFSIFCDLGLANLMTREAAKNANEPGANQKLLGMALSIKLPLTFLNVLILTVFLAFSDYDILSKRLIQISMLSMVFDSFTYSFYAFSRAYHNLKYESIGSVAYQALMLILGYAILQRGDNLLFLMSTLATASFVSMLYSFSIIYFKWNLRPSIKFSWMSTKHFLSLSLPFALFGILQRIFSYLDSVLLGHMAGERAVGLYQVAFKFVFSLQFLPLAFVASLYPAFAAYWQNNKEQLPITFERAFKYLLLLSLPISAGTFLTADKLVALLNPEYMEAVPALRISILSLVPLFLSYPVGSLLNACDRQRENTWSMFYALLLSVFLNILLIPRYGATGASFSALMSTILLLTIGFIKASRLIEIRVKSYLRLLWRSLAAVLLMSAFVILTKSLNLFLVIIIAAPVYAWGVFIFGLIKKEDMLSILASLRR